MKAQPRQIRQGNVYGTPGEDIEMLKRMFPSDPIQTFAQRKAGRVARPVNERLRGMIESRAANMKRLERARRERLTPDEFEAGLPGIGQGLHTLDMRSGLYQKNIDKIIADAKKVGKAGVRKATSRKPLMETPYDKRDMALMAALLGTAGAVKYSGAADRVWEEE